MFFFEVSLPSDRTIYPLDALAYWSAWAQGSLYPAGTSINVANYIYPPPFAQVIWPLTLLPFPAFLMLWIACGIAVYGWLLEPLPLSLRLPAAVAVATIVPQGNASFLVAATVVVAMWRPQAWAVPLLTKVTSIAAMSWYIARGEWRRLGIAVATATIIAAVSILIAPDDWFTWVRTVLDLHANRPGLFLPGIAVYSPLWLRLPLAALIAALGGRRSWSWSIPVAILVANPDVYGSTFGVLAAIPRLAQVNPDATTQAV
ncbi:MAG TPA: glycosyltransferase family 87 protein [Candidatus Limnocylindrales bacterium]|nr:glycosyltransferase family 87 protein [Candidatus Limnocylindrales bacterium]